MAQSKFTEAVRLAIVESLKVGNFARTACDLAGVNTSTYHDWINRGEAEADNESSEYAQFARDVAHARATAESKALGVIQKAAFDGDWKAAAWFLSKAYPERWAEQDWRKKPDDTPQDFTVELGPPPATEPPPADDDPTGEFPALSPDLI